MAVAGAQRMIATATSPGDRRRLLVVDDSAVARAVMTRAVEADGRFEIAGAVPDVAAALARLATASVDAIVLDIELPGIDGLTALPDLLAASGRAPVLVVSSSCGEGAAATIQALALGAADTLVKPAAGAAISAFGERLIEKLVRLTDRAPLPTIAPGTATRVAADAFDIVAIGASTGGIHALSLLLRALPASFTLPILVTQHLPASFMPYFAAQVAVLATRPCDVATDRMRVRPGRVVVAPGDAHLRLAALPDGGACVRLTHEASPSGCMPSVDPMFESLAQVYGPRALAVVLSGMGRDGERGARRIAAGGGCIVVQDQASSVIWGMPGAVASGAGADAILPPDAIGRLVASCRWPA